MEIKTAEEIREAMKNKFENDGQNAFETICNTIMKRIESAALDSARFFAVIDFERELDYLEISVPDNKELADTCNYLKYIFNSYKSKSNQDKELYNAFESQVVNLFIVKGYTVEKEEGLLNRFKIIIRWNKEDSEMDN